MTIREAVNFNFDDTSSEDMGVIIASPDSGLYEEHFMADRSIIETKIPGRYKPYLQRVDIEPLSFPLTIFISEWKERDNIRQIARWLNQDYYKPLSFDSQPDKVYYAIFEGASNINHNGTSEGYVTLNVRCDSPYSYSRVVKTIPTNDIAIYINNDGDLPIKPKARLVNHGTDGNIAIRNMETNQLITFKNIQKNEELFIDFENETIISSLEILNVFRHGDHNDEWLDFIVGENELELTGDFSIEFEYEMKYLS